MDIVKVADRQDKFVLMIILAYIFTIPLSYFVSTVLMLLGIVGVFYRKFRYHRPWIRTSLDKPLLVFVVMVGFSIVFSADPSFSFYNAWNLVGRYVLSYILIVQGLELNTRNLQLFIGTWLFSGVIAIIYGFMQAFWGIGLQESQALWTDSALFPQLATRIYSIWYNPNLFAGYLDLFIGIIVGLIIVYKEASKSCRLSLYALFILSFFCLSLTYARGAVFSIIATLIIYLGYYNRKFLGIFIIALILYLTYDDTLYHRLASLFTSSLDSSANMRLGLWISTLAMIKEHFFFGIGWGVYYLVYPMYDYYMQGHFIKIVHAHNMYLNIFAEIGFVGAMAFFWMYFSSIIRGWRFASGDLEKLPRGIALGFSIGLMALAFNGLSDYVLFNVELSELVYIGMAIIAKLFIIK